MSGEEPEEIVTSESVSSGGRTADAAEKSGDGSWGAEGGIPFGSELLDGLHVFECDGGLARARNASFALRFDRIEATAAVAAVFG